ncbi:MAG TPA: zinc ribbon domain-containing protein [Gemmatimonadaceae bacterium]|nr:zinc ribbon domain-containing protein [Gemmatimonadaceae bacterium]
MTTPTPPASPTAPPPGTDPAATTRCPSCGAAASGRFCSSCGTALAGATCATCSAALTPGARFCHRCGTPAGAPSAAPTRGFASALPWGVAALALVSLTALVVGQRFGARNTPPSNTEVLDGANGQGTTVITQGGPEGAAPAPGMPRAPDISQLTPEQRAERLYDRIMTEHEAGRQDAVRSFLPMAVAAYQMLDSLNLDQRYDLGRLGEVGGDTTLARAQADTILEKRPTHLLGLILGARIARMEGNDARARALDGRLVAAAPQERNAGLPEYLLHKNDIDSALAAARPSAK